jgi:hypothetical protein
MQTCMEASSRLEKRLAELVAFDTRNPGGDERALAEYLARDLTALGARTTEVFASAGHYSTFACFGAQPHPDPQRAHRHSASEQRLQRRSARARPARRPTARPGQRRHQGGHRGHPRSPGPAEGVGSGAGRPGRALFRRRRAGRRLHPRISGQRAQPRPFARHRVRAHRLPRRRSPSRRVRGAISATSPGGHSSLAESVPNPLTALARAAVALDDLGVRCRDLGPRACAACA